LPLQLQVRFGPGRGDDLRDLPVGHAGQPGEDVFEIGVRINAPTTAAFDHGINDGSPFSRIRIAHEQPVLLADGRGADGVFDQVVVDLHPVIIQTNRKMQECASTDGEF